VSGEKMVVFLSYASPDRDAASSIGVALLAHATAAFRKIKGVGLPLAGRPQMSFRKRHGGERRPYTLG
jgi:hypothetical protein